MELNVYECLTLGLSPSLALTDTTTHTHSYITNKPCIVARYHPNLQVYILHTVTYGASLSGVSGPRICGVTAFMRWIVLSLACHKLFVAALDILPTWHTFPAGDSTIGSLVSMPLIPRDIPRCAGYLSMPRHLTQSYLHAGCNSAARPSCQSVDASERKHKLIGHDTNQFTCNIRGVITEDSTFMRIFFCELLRVSVFSV